MPPLFIYLEYIYVEYTLTYNVVGLYHGDKRFVNTNSAGFNNYFYEYQIPLTNQIIFSIL